MGKSRRRNRNSSPTVSSTARRDVRNITNAIHESLLAPVFSPVTSLRLYEDRRLWHPEGRYAPARSFSRSRHRLREVAPSRVSEARRSRSVSNMSSLPVHRIGFERPERVLICVRRKMRREVLFARRKTGRGVKRRRPRFNWYSKISCRR